MGIFTICKDFVLLWFFNVWKGYNLVRCKKFDIAEHLLSLMTYLRIGCTKLLWFCSIIKHNLQDYALFLVNVTCELQNSICCLLRKYHAVLWFFSFSWRRCNLSCSHQGCAHCCKQLCDIGLLTSVNLQPPTVFLSIFCPPSDVQKSHCTVSLSPGK